MAKIHAFTYRLQRLIKEKPMYIRPLIAKSIAYRLAKISPDYFETRTKRPFFIIGVPRSGTTLLVNTLANHHDIATYPDEANELWHPQTYPWRYSAFKDSLPPIEVDPREFTALSLQYRDSSDEKRLRSVFGCFQYLMARECFLNKSSLISFMIPYILDQYPDAKFIHIYRDGRAVVRSWAEKLDAAIRQDIELYENQQFGISHVDLIMYCANSWQEQMTEIATQRHRLELDKEGALIELKYEDFCKSPRDYLFQLTAFMGVSSRVFAERSLEHIKSMNYKYHEEFSADQLEQITQIMEPALDNLAYI